MVQVRAIVSEAARRAAEGIENATETVASSFPSLSTFSFTLKTHSSASSDSSSGECIAGGQCLSGSTTLAHSYNDSTFADAQALSPLDHRSLHTDQHPKSDTSLPHPKVRAPASPTHVQLNPISISLPLSERANNTILRPESPSYPSNDAGPEPASPSPVSNDGDLAESACRSPLLSKDTIPTLSSPSPPSPSGSAAPIPGPLPGNGATATATPLKERPSLYLRTCCPLCFGGDKPEFSESEYV